MRNSSRYTPWCLIAALGVCAATLLAASARGDTPAPPAPQSDTLSPADETPQREIFVPFEDLHVILSGDTQRVFVTRGEYESLLAKARKNARPNEQGQPAAILSADYSATIEENHARFLGTLVVAAPSNALSAVPLDLSGVALQSATLDGKPASLGRDPSGCPTLFVSGPGRHELKLDILAPLETAAAQRTLSYEIPTPPATRIKLTVPGNVEIKSGATIIRRDVDDRPATTFDLLPRRSRNTVVLSLNNHQLRKESVVVAHAVMIDEITSAYERLHATESLSVLHGAAERFRFEVPEGFEVTSVAGPQVARWSMATEGGRRMLNVDMREPITDTASLDIAAIRTPIALDKWRLPKLTALDVAGQEAVVGLLVESRLKTDDLHATNLISIDTGVVSNRLPAGALDRSGGAPLTAVAAFYAPHEDYNLSASFSRPPDELRVTTNALLTLTESKLEVHGGFALMDVTDKLLGFDFSAPPGWQVTEVTLDGGTVLSPEMYPAADGGTRIHVRLPHAAVIGGSRNILFHAVSTPDGWLDEWKTKRIEFPVFQVAGAARDGGAIAVEPQDDMTALADKVTRLTPLESSEKGQFGLANVATQLAYRFERPPYGLTLSVERVAPRLTARAYSFFRVEPNLLTAHYEIAYNVAEARTGRLNFALPASTPAELAIHGLDGIPIKESSSAVEANQRQWTVSLGDRRRGPIRLAIDFQQPIGTPKIAGAKGATAKDSGKAVQPPTELALPLVRATHVAYQTGMVAVEGSSDADVQLKTELRKVDVGRLAEADYQPGRRLLGAFGYGGDRAEVRLTIARPAGYELPSAIVERSEMLTMISASGRSQTVARFQLRCKAQLIDVQLPPGSTLWSAYLDGKPTLPQREAGSLLVELPATSEASRRDLQLVYETPVAALGMASSLDLAAPKLALRAKGSTTGEEVPLADLVWQLCTPDGFKVVRSNGTVFSGDIAQRESPVANVTAALGDVFATSRERSRTRNYSRIVDGSESMQGEAKTEAPMAGPRASAARAVRRSGFAVNGKETNSLTTNSFDVPRSAAPGEPGAKSAEAAPPPAPPEKSGAGIAALDNAFNAPSSAPLAESKQSLWALEGVRSLPIVFESGPVQTTFQSLGEVPRLDLTLVDRQRFELLAWFVGLLVFFRGVMLTRAPRWRRFRFIALTLVVSFALPLILPWTGVLSPVCNAAFYAACWLVPYYLAAGVARWFLSLGHSAVKPAAAAVPAATAVIALLMLVPRGASADEPAPPPVVVPPDAIIVPYDPATQDPLKALETPAHAKPGEKQIAKPFGMEKSQRLLVPYNKYLELQHAAHPDQIVRPAPPAEYALSAGRFSARLDGGESLLIEGNLDVNVLVDHPVSIPLTLSGGVLTKADVDGKPGMAAMLRQSEPTKRKADENPFADHPRTRPHDIFDEPAHPGPVPEPKSIPVRKDAAARPADGAMVLLLSGAGLKHVSLAMRFPLKRSGGWQIAEGRLPLPPAAELSLEIEHAGTEVVLLGGADHGHFEAKRDHETVDTALAADGAFRLQWRAKAEQAPVDRSLAARGTARFDVEEAGLRLAWRFDLEFRRSQRDSFTIDIPAGYLVENVTGTNVRGWNLSEAGGLRKLDVTLLKAAQDAESFAVSLLQSGAVGSGNLKTFTAPVLNVEGAAQQSGEMTIRSSPLLELRTESADGASRADADASQTNAAGGSDASPLGIVSFQAYRFATVPFAIKLSAQAVRPRISADLQTVLKIGRDERTVESRIRMQVDGRPIYRLQIAVPEDLRIDRVTAPEPFQWILAPQTPEQKRKHERRTLNLYFAAGQQKSFDVVLSGMLGKYGPTDAVAAPLFDVSAPIAAGAAAEQTASIEQSGHIAVESDPSLDVQADKLVHCETELIDRVLTWLNPAQQKLARLALRYHSPDYAAELQLSPRKPLVRCDTYSNVRVNERTVEETLLLDYTIREAGIRSLSFLLPESMRDARISAPMIRQKTVEPDGDAKSQVRVRIELQGDLMGNLRVFVENDHLTSSEKYVVPTPTSETGQTDHRFITLESAGRDEVVVDTHEGVDPISREQNEWQMLTSMLGRGLTQAYLVHPGFAHPLLTLHSVDRAAVETAGARIGLAKTMLVVDANGAYRGAQLYRVDNNIEQFLEVQLPPGARLWTAHVAGEPVKPAAGSSASGAAATPGLVRIPLVKTARGDADYAVVLKYGGELGRLGAVDRLDFPMIRTVNIHVELSQVELYLPESYDWFNFGGTMRHVKNEGDLAAGWLAYNTKQIGLAARALRGDDPFARARAAQNLKSLQAESAALKRSAEAYRGNAEVAEQLQANTSVQTGLDAAAATPADEKGRADGEARDNRERLGRLYTSQTNSLASDVVNSSGANFAPPAETAPFGNPSNKVKGQGNSMTWRTRTLAEQPKAEPAAGPMTGAGFGGLGGSGALSAPNGSATTASTLDRSGNGANLGAGEFNGQPAAPQLVPDITKVTVSGGTITASGASATFNGGVLDGNAPSQGTSTLAVGRGNSAGSSGFTRTPPGAVQFRQSGVDRAQDLERYKDRLANQGQQPSGSLGINFSLNGGDSGGRRDRDGTFSGGGGKDGGWRNENGPTSGAVSGTGVLTLNGANTYTGGTAANSGASTFGGMVDVPAQTESINDDSIVFRERGGGVNLDSGTNESARSHRESLVAQAPQARSGKKQPSQSQPGLTVAKPAPAVLASLDVDLRPRGVRYLFTTPRGDTEITARAVSDSLEARIARLAGLAFAVAVVLLLSAAIRRRSAARLAKATQETAK